MGQRSTILIQKKRKKRLKLEKKLTGVDRQC